MGMKGMKGMSSIETMESRITATQSELAALESEQAALHDAIRERLTADAAGVATYSDSDGRKDQARLYDLRMATDAQRDRLSILQEALEAAKDEAQVREVEAIFSQMSRQGREARDLAAKAILSLNEGFGLLQAAFAAETARERLESEAETQLRRLTGRGGTMAGFSNCLSPDAQKPFAESAFLRALSGGEVQQILFNLRPEKLIFHFKDHEPEDLKGWIEKQRAAAKSGSCPAK